MKKLAVSLAIISALSLSACDNETIEDVQQDAVANGSAVTPLSRIAFDPSNSVISIPNDLLYSESADGTLNLPVEDATDFSDPIVAMSALDGWSTTNPFLLAIDLADGVTLDATSVSDPASIKIYQTLMGGDDSDEDCKDLTRGLACKVVEELTFEVDFTADAIGNNVAVIPLKPFKGKTSYVVALTNNLKDSNGKAVAGSITYELVRQDITTNPLVTESQLLLQGLTNSFESAISAAGAEKDSLIYTFAMTTQSTSDVLFTLKNLLAATIATEAQPSISVEDTGITVAQAFNAQGIPLSESATALYSTAQLHTGVVKLPYYLGVPMQANPQAPVTDWWTALCDSGVMLKGLAASNPDAIPEGPLTTADGICMSAGLRDLSSLLELDVERNLTQYNPIPKASSEVSDIPWVTNPGLIDVQMTTPVISPSTDAVRASFGLPALTAAPENGWPVVILQHGITTDKESMLAMTGVLSTFGFATVAIDHPLHGSRGFDVDGDGNDDINATTISPTHYMNLASLLTTRDNLRQSTSDMLGLRLGLSELSGAGVVIDNSQVHLLGHSLGAITGLNLVALANTPLNSDNDAMFSIKTNSQAAPGVMIAHFLMESGSFENVIKSNLTYASSEEFQGYVAQVHASEVPPTSVELAAYYEDFYKLVAQESPEKIVALETSFSQFTIAAQTVLESGDPVNYLATMQATNTPTHLIEVVGNNGNNLSDQVIPNTVSTSTVSGTEAAITLLGLPSVLSESEEAHQGSGAVRFTYGHHGSLLTPASIAGIAPDPDKTTAATTEMQGQVAGFFATMGQQITITDSTIIK